MQCKAECGIEVAASEAGMDWHGEYGRVPIACFIVNSRVVCYFRGHRSGANPQEIEGGRRVGKPVGMIVGWAVLKRNQAMKQRETLIAWLNDAYGLEQNLTKVLENRVKDADGHPQLQSQLNMHLEETRRHVDLVEQCIEHLGGTPSSTKSFMGKISGMFSGAATGMADDEIIKNMLSDYSMEHLEIASYLSIIAAAEALGEQEIAQTCREILHDEQDMAEWIHQQIPTVTNEYLMRQPV